MNDKVVAVFTALAIPSSPINCNHASHDGVDKIDVPSTSPMKKVGLATTLLTTLMFRTRDNTSSTRAYITSNARVATVRLGTLVGCDDDGADDGPLLGVFEFFIPQLLVGNAVGWPEGRLDGAGVGSAYGAEEGTKDGTEEDGMALGELDGNDGNEVGMQVGTVVGSPVGCADGCPDGRVLGCPEGCPVG
jgi:hypothetical protein